MDENVLIQFLRQAKSISLGEAAKKNGRERLLAAINQSRPLPETSFADGYNHGFFFNYFHMRRAVLVGTLIGALVFTTSVGTSLAAEKSLPGGTLYPIKTNINERVLGSLALSDQAKLKWQMKRIERRIAEADALASEGRLNDGSLQEIENLTSQQMQDVGNLVQKLEDNNTAGAEVAKEQFTRALQSGNRVHLEISDQKVTITEKHEGAERQNDRNEEERDN